MWTEKYRNIKYNQIIGNEYARKTFYSWLKNWRKGDRAVLLVGQAGTGKNTSIYAAARELGYFVIELNASDVRTKESLTRKLDTSLYISNLFDEKRLVLLDEVDGIYGREDYGGTEYVNELLEKPPLPIVLTANDYDNDNVLKLAKKTMIIHFQKVPLRMIEMYLKHIAELENKEASRKLLSEVTRRSRGDVRAAINLLQSVVNVPDTVKQISILKDAVISKRDAILALFEEGNVMEVFHKFSKINVNAKEKVHILFYSILASDLGKEQRKAALKAIADIDIFERRMESTQEWRMLKWYDMIIVEKLRNLDLRKKFRYFEEEPIWELKLKYWTELRIFKNAKEMVNQKLHVSIGEFVLYYLPCLISLSKKDQTAVAEYLEHSGFDESLITYIEKKVKIK
ncbi:MAG: AAA family ATPase [Nitrososphaeria archaeon]